jgi:hypothetical protein
MMLLPLDSDSRGPRLFNVSARAETNGQILLSGVYDAGDLLPVLLFSVGVPWVEPCLRHVCCLWDVLERYRDHSLMDALGPTCDERVNLTNKDLMKGNKGTAGRWEVATMIHPSFVAMLFLCLGPVFCMYHEIAPVEWETGSTRWSSAWYGQPCQQVTYTDGRKLCIYCANEKPTNAQFVFTPNWFQTFQCKWECLAGFTGPGCELPTTMVVGAVAGGVLLLALAAGVWRIVTRDVQKKTVSVVDIPRKDEAVSQLQSQKFRSNVSDVISFKEGALHEIRIKLL